VRGGLFSGIGSDWRSYRICSGSRRGQSRRSAENFARDTAGAATRSAPPVSRAAVSPPALAAPSPPPPG